MEASEGVAQKSWLLKRNEIKAKGEGEQDQEREVGGGGTGLGISSNTYRAYRVQRNDLTSKATWPAWNTSKLTCLETLPFPQFYYCQQDLLLQWNNMEFDYRYHWFPICVPWTGGIVYVLHKGIPVVGAHRGGETQSISRSPCPGVGLTCSDGRGGSLFAQRHLQGCFPHKVPTWNCGSPGLPLHAANPQELQFNFISKIF